MALFERLSSHLPLVFGVHPRTRKRLDELGYQARSDTRLYLSDPFDYLDSICLQKNATLVLTDSGGMQEETSWLGVPCITLRSNTERPVTVEEGTSFLVGNKPEAIEAAFHRILMGGGKAPKPIPLWDGRAAGRIVDCLERRFTGPT
jgi:UDP-N-acetylglucosamine 2-epimerase (non-hydrolysing)